jgi:peptidoglycan/xylan/chitin deacetylase (PgdA/CDA1 family)
MKATFAVLGYAAKPGKLPYHAPWQIREIAVRGHEVASHTWEHEWIPDMTYDRLLDTLRRSKEQLEDTIGKSVISFAPPWNVPTRYLSKMALGLYDLRRSKHPRIDIPILCRALQETGYKTARIAYETIFQSISRHLFRKITLRPTRAQWIENILCFQVNGDGFENASVEIIRQAAKSSGLAVIYAHPHSLVAENDQNLQYFIPFLEVVHSLCAAGEIIVTTPGELYRDWQRISD